MAVGFSHCGQDLSKAEEGCSSPSRDLLTGAGTGSQEELQGTPRVQQHGASMLCGSGARTWRCELAALAIQGPVPGLTLWTSSVMERALAPLPGMPALNPGLARTSSLSSHPRPRRIDAGLGNCSPVPTAVERRGILFPEARPREMIWTAVAPGSLDPEARP